MQGEEGVVSRLRTSDEVFVPSIVLGKLFFGAAKSGRPAGNLAAVERFAAGRTIVECNLAAAREYGKIKPQLRQKGRPIPENDIWIAAMAVANGLTLATRDDHFDHVEGLATVAWTPEARPE